jgi:hypothetical protein
MAEALKVSPFQERVLLVPEEFDLALLGGRGGAKSYTLALLALRHVEQYALKARVLYVRRTHAGTADFEALCRDLFGLVYGTGVRYNAQEGLFRFPNGGTLEINQVEDTGSYGKFQGRSFSLLLVDEAGQFPVPDLLDRLRSNLRGPKDVPIRVALAANPGDVGHSWLLKRHAWNVAWRPYTEPASERTFVHCPSTFLDNPFIDQAEYKRQLGASCPSDPELLKAWLEGDWTAQVRGAFFGAVLDQQRNVVELWPGAPAGWDVYLAHDFGVSAPSVTYVLAKSPGAKGPDGRWYPRDSLVAVDELATNEPGRLDRGMGYTVPILAEQVKAMCTRWSEPAKASPGLYQRVRPMGVADDSIFAAMGSGAGSISDEFRRAGVNFSPAKKADRLTGWNIMRRLLQDAGKPDKPGLYVARHCSYFWESVPTLGRDPRRPEDLDSRGPDHAADAMRYGCLRLRLTATAEPLRV